MRVAIFGAGGQLGQALEEVLQQLGRSDVKAFAKADVDVTDPSAVAAAVQAYRPDVLINAAAMTDVDGCERNEAAAYQVNALAARWLACQAERLGALFIHVSTDYVFDGQKGAPYHEWDAVRPIQAYGHSKQMGEEEVRSHCPRHLIVRTSWLYGGSDKGFVRAVLRRAKSGEAPSVVTAQSGSPSYAGDVARGICDLMDKGAVGTVHLSNAGRASRFEFAEEIVRQAGLSVAVLPAGEAPATALAQRPSDTSLTSFVLETVGIRMPSWQEGLQSFIRDKEV